MVNKKLAALAIFRYNTHSLFTRKITWEPQEFDRIIYKNNQITLKLRYYVWQP